jgi:hypothetical protein
VFQETHVGNPEDKDLLTFVPFLKNCAPNPESFRIWQTVFRGSDDFSDFYNQYEKYLSFYVSHERYEERKKTNGYVYNLKRKLGISEDTRDIVTIMKERIPDWDDAKIRCPFSWYKSYFHGGARKTRKSRKARKTRKSRKHIRISK